MPRILRRAVTAPPPRAHILANAAVALFLVGEKRAGAASSIIVQMQLLSFRANARRAARKKGGIFVRRSARDPLKTDFQLADAGRKITRRMRVRPRSAACESPRLR